MTTKAATAPWEGVATEGWCDHKWATFLLSDILVDIGDTLDYPATFCARCYRLRCDKAGLVTQYCTFVAHHSGQCSVR